jgi:hypothetical protein
MTHIRVICWPDEETRTPNSACAWVAETMVEGRVYVARSRHGAPNELARQLVIAGLPDRPMVVHYRGRVGTTTYRSFHAAATWTFSEGDQPLHRVRYREQPEGLFLVSGTGQKCVSSPVTDEMDLPAVDTHEMHCPTMRFCDACGGDFMPSRRWSRFCSAACRLRAHRLSRNVSRQERARVKLPQTQPRRYDNDPYQYRDQHPTDIYPRGI